MRLGLYLRTSRGAHVLSAAIGSGADIAFVVTATDGGMPEDGTDSIVGMCRVHGIECFADGHAPARDADRSTHTIAAGWRSMLNAPNLIVLHDSLLPKYRGWSPLLAALINGEREVGVTAILAEQDGFDTGPIVGQERMAVAYPMTIKQALGCIERLYYRLTSQILEEWPAVGTPQNEDDATYSIWRDHDDYRIDWAQDAERIRRHVDACGHPHPGAWTTIPLSFGQQPILVVRAEEVDDVTFVERHPGKVLRLDAGRPVVVCGTGLLRLDELAWPPLTVTGSVVSPQLSPWRSVRTRFA